jgi:hypothetical protein
MRIGLASQKMLKKFFTAALEGQESNHTIIVARFNVETCQLSCAICDWLVKKKRAVNKRPWSDEERSCVLSSALGHYVRRRGNLPGKKECEELLLSHQTLLTGRTWTNIKDFVCNEQTKFFHI